MKVILILTLLLAACSPMAATTTETRIEATLPPPGEVRITQLNEPVSDVAAAEVTVNLAFEDANIASSEGALLDAEIQHVNDLDYEVSGDRTRIITLSEKASAQHYTGSSPLEWMLRFSPDVPLALTLTMASGSLDLNAADLSLTTLNLDAQSGTTRLALPAEHPLAGSWSLISGEIEAVIPANAQVTLDDVRVTSGTLRLIIAENANVTLTVSEIGSGLVALDVPDEAAVRLEVESVISGLVDVAYAMNRLEASGETGVWETASYANAEQQITVFIQSIQSGRFSLE